jgi:hypothetical protein
LVLGQPRANSSQDCISKTKQNKPSPTLQNNQSKIGSSNGVKGKNLQLKPHFYQKKKKKKKPTNQPNKQTKNQELEKRQKLLSFVFQ